MFLTYKHMKTMTSENIRQLRRILGQTQGEFAVTIGASKDTVASWETGRNRLSAGMARRIALATGADERSLLKAGARIMTLDLPRRSFTLAEFEQHRKTFWGGNAVEQVLRHVERCGDALELLFRAAAGGGEDGGESRLAGVLGSFIQWCKETRRDFRLEKRIDALLGHRKAKLELNKSYAQWREMKRTDPDVARQMGFKDDPKKGAQEMLKLSIETVPVWMPGHSMRGGRKAKS